MHIVVNQQYLCDVFDGWNIVEGSPIKYGTEEVTSSYSRSDHPAFLTARNLLHEHGFIEVETRWINGDVVVKDFSFNDYKFQAGEQFPCASALRNKLTTGRKLKCV
jgi:hypothetical protein